MRKDLESMLEKTMKGGDSIDELCSENCKIVDNIMYGVVTESFNDIRDVISDNDKNSTNALRNVIRYKIGYVSLIPSPIVYLNMLLQ